MMTRKKIIYKYMSCGFQFKMFTKIFDKGYIFQNMPHIENCQDFTLSTILIYQGETCVAKKDDTVQKMDEMS